MIPTRHSPLRARAGSGPRAFFVQVALYLVFCFALLVMLPALLGGCAARSDDQLTAPRQLVAPYDTSRSEPVWAVFPLRNESGTSAASSAAISDAIVAAAAQTRGLRVLPLNRTLEAMMALQLERLDGPDDASALAEAMGVDGLILGSITAYDPYTPTLGLSLALYIRPGALQTGAAQLDLDARALVWQPTDYAFFTTSAYEDRPASAVSEHLDGKSHAVQLAVRDFAEGRSDPVSSLGWRRYLASMGLFTEFAAWHTVGRLLDHEWIRLASGSGKRPPALVQRAPSLDP